MDSKELVDIALNARQLSYSPYSNFKVGAAVLCKNGEVFVGSNIENAAYGLCMCAERNALYNAMMHGMKKDDFVMFAVVADTDKPCSPCGSCRQVLDELYPANAPIYCANLKGDIKETNVKELLPFSFGKDDLQ